jgi:hypothetical protein
VPQTPEQLLDEDEEGDQESQVVVESVSTATLMPSNYNQRPWLSCGGLLRLSLLELTNGDFQRSIQPPRFRPSR